MSTGLNGPAITFSGLGTGIDTASIVSQLMLIERQPISTLASQKQRVQGEQGVVQNLNSLIKSLKDKAEDLLKTGAFDPKTAASTDAAVLSPTADSTAAAGSYNVVVTALAKAHTMASATAPVLSNDTLQITVGSKTINVESKSTDTLQGLADKINAATDSPVAASVINDRLVMISRTSGSAGGISVTSTGGQAAALGMATTQPATDAAATVNGLAVTSSGNTITGAIAGVTLKLTKEGSATVNVGTDTANVEAKVKAFVDAYNTVVSNVGAATKYDAASKTAGTLQGDQTFSSFNSQLRGLAGAAVGMLGDVTHNSLAQIGITMDRSGVMTLNSATFQSALAADPSAIRKVFASDDGNADKDVKDGVAVRIANFAKAFSDETLSSRLSGYTSSIQRMDKKTADLEALMVLKEKRLKAQFAAMDAAVSQLQSQGSQLAARLSSL
jgi:flagellar hook-associated protein 2